MSPSHGAPFRGVRDHAESPFFRAGPIEMSTELLCSWHRDIFSSLFPEHAGRLRGSRHGELEHVYFGGHVGTRRSRRIREYRGTDPRKLPNRLEEICAEFNATAAALRESPGTDSFSAVYAATRLYAKLLRAHPWIDGNLRAESWRSTPACSRSACPASSSRTSSCMTIFSVSRSSANTSPTAHSPNR
jgi:hypothetical protein